VDGIGGDVYMVSDGGVDGIGGGIGEYEDGGGIGEYEGGGGIGEYEGGGGGCIRFIIRSFKAFVAFFLSFSLIDVYNSALLLDDGVLDIGLLGVNSFFCRSFTDFC